MAIGDYTLEYVDKVNSNSLLNDEITKFFKLVSRVNDRLIKDGKGKSIKFSHTTLIENFGNGISCNFYLLIDDTDSGDEIEPWTIIEIQFCDNESKVIEAYRDYDVNDGFIPSVYYGSTDNPDIIKALKLQDTQKLVSSFNDLREEYYEYILGVIEGN